MKATNYSAVAEAARRLDERDTSSTWALADAILAYVPSEGRTGRPESRASESPTFVPVEDRLRDLAERLAADEIRTPNGDDYSWHRLAHLRKLAMAWPAAQRHADVAARTHEQASNDTARAVLAALVKYADGETVRKPSGIDADNWTEARTRVRSRTKGWKVNRNDLLIALGRKPNNNTSATLDADTVRQAIATDPEIRAAAIGTALNHAPEEVEAAGRAAFQHRMRQQYGAEIPNERRLIREADPHDEAIIEIQRALHGLSDALRDIHHLIDARPDLWAKESIGGRSYLARLERHRDLLAGLCDMARGVSDEDLLSLLEEGQR